VKKRIARHRLQICVNSGLATQSTTLQRLREGGCVVEIEQCLDQCPHCEKRTFALVDGRILFAASPVEFLLRLKIEP
jgi:uncharacterized protein YuzB (UPF0349 family)